MAACKDLIRRGEDSDLEETIALEDETLTRFYGSEENVGP